MSSPGGSLAPLIYVPTSLGDDFRVAGFVRRKKSRRSVFCMGIRGDMRSPIQSINLHSTPHTMAHMVKSSNRATYPEPSKSPTVASTPKWAVACGVEWRFMVCMSLRGSPRIPIQKTDLRDFFRRTKAATRKSSPNLLGTYMRRAGERHSKPTQLNYTCLGGCS